MSETSQQQNWNGPPEPSMTDAQPELWAELAAWERKRANRNAASLRTAEAENKRLHALLDDAMGLLHNHVQDDHPGWLKDYDDVCRCYSDLLEQEETDD